MLAAPVSIITSRSMPRPTPPVGGIPCSSASMKTSSKGWASSSPRAISAACCSNRRRCSSGSLSSLNELAISTPPAKASQRSTRPSSERWALAKGESSVG